jgi:hypothetical protein
MPFLISSLPGCGGIQRKLYLALIKVQNLVYDLDGTLVY